MNKVILVICLAALSIGLSSFAIGHSLKVRASAPAQVADCKAGSTEQCPSDKFRADYTDWKAKHEEISKLMKSDGHVSELTRLDHEWKGMRDDLTQLAQQECPGCTFDDKTMKFTKPQPAPTK